MSFGEALVYHVVTPGDPEENGCSCLNGVGVDDSVGFVMSGIDADVSGIGSLAVGPLVAAAGGVLKRLKLGVSNGNPITRWLWNRTHLCPWVWLADSCCLNEPTISIEVAGSKSNEAHTAEALNSKVEGSFVRGASC